MRLAVRRDVSIRPQFANRRKHDGSVPRYASRRFQSAPSSQTGGNPATASPDCWSTCFNPPPVRKPEETGPAGLNWWKAVVSIRPQFANRRKPDNSSRTRARVQVSIRPQFANRRKLGSCTAGSCTVGSVSIRPQFANRRKLQRVAGCPHNTAVSIRPQFANRRKRVKPSGKDVVAAGFNPPPVRKPEETRLTPATSSSRPRFQSAPSSQTGGNVARDERGRFSHAAHVFQSAPSSQTGGNAT